MGRFRNVDTGVVITVADAKDERYTTGWESATGDQPAATADYKSMKVADLKAEVGRRNDGRDEAVQLSADGKKADLVAQLEADDR